MLRTGAQELQVADSILALYSKLDKEGEAS